jgi:hypothetical protein
MAAIPGFDDIKNLATGNIATAPVPANSGTSVTLGTGQGARMPAVPFNALMWPAGVVADPTNSEIVRATARPGNADTFTITRAQESTTAMTVANGYYFAANVTELTLRDIEQQIADGIGYNVAHNKIANLVGDDSTDNTAAWNTLFAALPVGALVYFPPGTYRGNFVISADKHLAIYGAGRYTSIIKANHALADPSGFHITGVFWYNTFSDLGFASTSTTSAATVGINIDPGVSAFGAVGINIHHCDFQNLGTAIRAVGVAAANVSTWDDITITSPTTITGARGIVLDGTNINMQMSNLTINMGPAAANSSACMEIKSMGALQVTQFDFIGGTNTILFSATGLTAACQFVNGFCDQSGGSTVKFTGTASVSRITFVAVSITGGNVAGATAIEVAGTGTGAAGTATSQPDGIDFFDCSVYPNGGSGTLTGFLISGAQGVNIAGCRISGWTSGITVTPTVANGYTKVYIKDNKMGATNNFTTFNTTGVTLNAGGFQYGAIHIADNDFSGSTTPITDNSTSGNFQKNIAGNLGLPKGTGISSTKTATTTTEAIVVQIPLPANCLRIGSKFRVKLYGSHSAVASVVNLRARLGTAGTTADQQIGLLAPTATAAVQAVIAEMLITMTAIGAAATAACRFTGEAKIQAGGANQTVVPAGAYVIGLATVTNTVISTQVANFLTITVAAATSSQTDIYDAVIEVLQE